MTLQGAKEKSPAMENGRFLVAPVLFSPTIFENDKPIFCLFKTKFFYNVFWILKLVDQKDINNGPSCKIHFRLRYFCVGFFFSLKWVLIEFTIPNLFWFVFAYQYFSMLNAVDGKRFLESNASLDSRNLF